MLKLLGGDFAWVASAPLISPALRPDDPCHAIKDPTVVQFNGRWHIFATIRSEKRTHQIEYLSFADWNAANDAPRHILTLSDGYFCAPQVFYFAPQKKWYLIYQISDPTRKPQLQPAFSTNDDIANPDGWSKPVLLFDEQPPNVRMWIDFWVICDDTSAYLFFTSLDGSMWRSETTLEEFPAGWTPPSVALRSDIFEASHTYKLKGLDRYLTIVEAQDVGRRYYKAFTATSLGGKWSGLADSQKKPFAGRANVRNAVGSAAGAEGAAESWTDSISHGELIRTGYDQTLEVDPFNLKMLFQGVGEADRAGKAYGQVPWQLGILEPDAEVEQKK